MSSVLKPEAKYGGTLEIHRLAKTKLNGRQVGLQRNIAETSLIDQERCSYHSYSGHQKEHKGSLFTCLASCQGEREQF